MSLSAVNKSRLSAVAAIGTSLALTLAVVTGIARPAGADTAPPPGLPATVSADALPTVQQNGVIWSEVTVGNTVYAAGSFSETWPAGMSNTSVNWTPRANLLAFDIRTGALTSFNHVLNAQALAVTASPDGSTIYVGGDFTTVDGVARRHIAAFNTTTGALVSTFAPSISGEVEAISVGTAGTVYVGGTFTSVNGNPRTRLAAFTSGGALTAWAPTADDNQVTAMVVTPDQSEVVIGGRFSSLDGTFTPGLGAVTATTGSWIPYAVNKRIQDYTPPQNAGTNHGAGITSLYTDGTQIYGSGYSYFAGNFEGVFAVEPDSGRINFLNDCQGDTYGVFATGQVLYDVSHKHDCAMVGGFPETSPRTMHHATAFTNYPTGLNSGPDMYGWNYSDLHDSTLLQWFPDFAIGTYTGQNQAAWSITGNSQYIALGGEFPTVNGGAQQGIVRFAISSLAPNKVGPQASASLTPSVTAKSPTSAKVSWTGTWDEDNQALTYQVFRDCGATPVYSATQNSTFWQLPTMSFTDTGLVAGSTHTYTVKVYDPFNNVTTGSPTTVTLPAGGGGGSAAPGMYAPVQPTRQLDTRLNVGGAGPVAAGGVVRLKVTGGCVPTGVSAVVLNLTVTQPTAGGFLTAYADGTQRPLASNLNFARGQTVPNLVVAPVSASGYVDIYNGSSGTSQIVADLAGYFVGGTPTVSGAFAALGPTRVLDTRVNLGGDGPVPGGGVVKLKVTGGTVPAGVSAVVMNVTVTQPTAAGFLTAYADGAPRPTASNLNFVAGQTVPNLVVAPVSANGVVDIYNGSGGTSQIVADLAGYFLGGTPTVSGAFTAQGPTRVLDTRLSLGAPGPVAAGGVVRLKVTGTVPAGVTAVVLNVTVTQPAAGGFLTAYADGTQRPLASNLNFARGQTVPNLVVAPVGANGYVDIYNGSGGTSQIVADLAGYVT